MTYYSLRQLEAFFVRYETRRETVSRLKPGIDPSRGNWTDEDFHLVEDDVRYMKRVDFTDAQGIWFDCPACYTAQLAGGRGAHGVCVSFADRGVADADGSHDSEGKPSRWQVSGTGYDDLVLSPSIYLKDCPPCNWHGFVGMSGIPPGHAG